MIKYRSVIKNKGCRELKRFYVCMYVCMLHTLVFVAVCRQSYVLKNIIGYYENKSYSSGHRIACNISYSSGHMITCNI